jgi:hypothetical protein
VTKYIPPVLIGLEFLNGKPVHLETTEYEAEEKEKKSWAMFLAGTKPESRKVRVVYTCKNRKVKRKTL